MRRCKRCSKSIDHKHPNAKFCESKCKDKFHNKLKGRDVPYRLPNPRSFDTDLEHEEDIEYLELGWDSHKGYW